MIHLVAYIDEAVVTCRLRRSQRGWLVKGPRCPSSCPSNCPWAICHVTGNLVDWLARSVITSNLTSKLTGHLTGKLTSNLIRSVIMLIGVIDLIRLLVITDLASQPTKLPVT